MKRYTRERKGGCPGPSASEKSNRIKWGLRGGAEGRGRGGRGEGGAGRGGQGGTDAPCDTHPLGVARLPPLVQPPQLSLVQPEDGVSCAGPRWGLLPSLPSLAPPLALPRSRPRRPPLPLAAALSGSSEATATAAAAASRRRRRRSAAIHLVPRCSAIAMSRMPNSVVTPAGGFGSQCGAVGTTGV